MSLSDEDRCHFSTPNAQCRLKLHSKKQLRACSIASPLEHPQFWFQWNKCMPLRHSTRHTAKLCQVPFLLLALQRLQAMPPPNYHRDTAVHHNHRGHWSPAKGSLWIGCWGRCPGSDGIVMVIFVTQWKFLWSIDSWSPDPENYKKTGTDENWCPWRLRMAKGHLGNVGQLRKIQWCAYHEIRVAL